MLSSSWLPLYFLSISSLIPASVISLEQCSWQFRPHPEDCGSYLVCNYGVPIVQRCPQGLHWNSRILNCDWKRSALCELESRPVGDSDNSILEDRSDQGEACSSTEQTHKPHSTDCSKYYVCNHGSWLEMGCTPPLVWNSAVTTCDWASNVDCSATSGGGGGVDGDGDGDGDVDVDVDGPVPPPPRPTTTVRPPRPTTSDGPPAPPPGWEEENAGPPSPPPPMTTTTKRPKPPHKPPPTTATPTGGGSGGSISGPDPTIVGIITGPPGGGGFHDPEHNDIDPDYKVICYYTGWSWYRPEEGKFGPDNVDGDLCTHYIYAFAILDSSTWTIKPADSWVDIDNKFYSKMTQLKKHGKKVTIALGGWNDSEGQKYSLLLRDPAKIQKLINSVVQFVKTHDFDGIDLDYEYPVCPQGVCHNDYETDRNGFTILVKGLRAALPKGSIISAAVSANRDVIDRAYDVRTLAASLDWIGVMDYDIHGSWEKQTGHIAPLYEHPDDTKDWLNVNYSINHWIKKGAPPAKLVMGVPFYGQAFSLLDPATNKSLNAPAKGPGNAGKYSRQRGILSYYEICGAKWSHRVQDEDGRMGPFLVEGDQWVSYDDVDMIQKKMTYIKIHGLGGAMAWALDFDDFNNQCGGGRYPLLTAMKDALSGGKDIGEVIQEGGGYMMME